MSAAKPTILIYGNCQGGSVAYALRSCPTIEQHYEIQSWENFPDNIHARNIPEDFKARCQIFLHQVGDWGRISPAAEGLPDNFVTVHFPPAASNALFPLRAEWPASTQHSPWPFALHGDFSDRIAIDLAARIPDKAEFLAEYSRTDISTEVDVARIHEFDLMWMERNEIASDVKISDAMRDLMPSQRICWIAGHITNAVLRVLLSRLVGSLAKQGTTPFRDAQEQIENELDAVFTGPELLGGLQAPIHPQVAQLLNLQWYDAAERCKYGEHITWTHTELVSAIYDYVRGNPLQV